MPAETWFSAAYMNLQDVCQQALVMTHPCAPGEHVKVEGAGTGGSACGRHTQA